MCTVVVGLCEAATEVPRLWAVYKTQPCDPHPKTFIDITTMFIQHATVRLIVG